MRSESDEQAIPVQASPQSHDYEPPSVTVLGTFAELTQQGAGATDELLNDGSQI